MPDPKQDESPLSEVEGFHLKYFTANVTALATDHKRDSGAAFGDNPTVQAIGEIQEDLEYVSAKCAVLWSQLESLRDKIRVVTTAKG